MEVVSSAKPGARYRVCMWNDISKPGAPIVGYGLSEKKAGERRYRPVGWNGEIHPWKSLAEAQQAVAAINQSAKFATADKGAVRQQATATQPQGVPT